MAERCPFSSVTDFSEDTVLAVYCGFFRRLVLPFFKTYGKSMLLGALKTDMEVADDVLDEQPLKESAKKRVPEGIKRTVQA